VARTPSILDNVQADHSVWVDIGMENVSEETDTGRFGRVIVTEGEFELVYAALPRGVYWADYAGSPDEEVVIRERGG